MNPILTITIDSGSYVAADKALRITMADAVMLRKATNEADVRPIANIVVARRLLGFSMEPAFLYSDFQQPAVEPCRL